MNSDRLSVLKLAQVNEQPTSSTKALSISKFSFTRIRSILMTVFRDSDGNAQLRSFAGAPFRSRIPIWARREPIRQVPDRWNMEFSREKLWAHRGIS